MGVGETYPTGHVDGKAVWLLAKFLGLDGLNIVKHEDSDLVPCDAGGPISSEKCPVVMRDGYGRFKALIPVRGVPLVSLVCFSCVCAYKMWWLVCISLNFKIKACHTHDRPTNCFVLPSGFRDGRRVLPTPRQGLRGGGRSE